MNILATQEKDKNYIFKALFYEHAKMNTSNFKDCDNPGRINRGLKLFAQCWCKSSS